MNEVLASRYAEIVHRLAVGIEPVDAVRDARAARGLRVAVEHPVGLRGAQALAHAGGRWSIRYVAGLGDHVDVRIDDPQRRFVARRLRFPVVALAAVRAAEAAGGHISAAQRTWRPGLYPGAAYGLAASATGIRGRATRAGAPARWVRVEATRPGTATVLGRAHGDDRGEFLLTIASDPTAPAELPDTIAVTITVRAAKPAPVAAAEAPPDPFWDLPLEVVAPPGPDDPVSAGDTLPPGYLPGFTATRDIELMPGRIRTDVLPFDLV